MLLRFLPLMLAGIAVAAPSEPMHPDALAPMIPWLSDSLESVRVVRCAAEAEFREPVETYTHEDEPGVTRRGATQHGLLGAESSCSYAVLHEMPDYRVLHVDEWGGGSGVFGTLLVVTPESRRLLLADLSQPAQPPSPPSVVSVPALRLIAQVGTGDRQRVRLTTVRPGVHRLDVRSTRGETPEVNHFELRLEGLSRLP